MAYTSEEASNKRCCGPEGTGEYSHRTEARMCVGDLCMAWRQISGTKDGEVRGVCGLAHGRTKVTTKVE